MTRVQTDEEEDLLEIEEAFELNESPEETLGVREEAGLVAELEAPREDFAAFFLYMLWSSSAACKDAFEAISKANSGMASNGSMMIEY